MAPVMRNIIHTSAKRAIYLGMVSGTISAAVYYATFVQPRQKKYEEFYANYDPYQRMREICATGKGYMHTCPEELVKLYEEKGIPIGSRAQAEAEESSEVAEE
uniref:COX6C domain-containing protein n=1 Tax=Strongyloides papillosus TaxID=174720 RepID=A0A0N5C2C4_STREA